MATLSLSMSPLDPAIFRDARPFTAGSAASSLPFPFPSVSIGAFRTLLGEPSSYADLPGLLAVSQRGPFLIASHNGCAPTLTIPSPADAVSYEISNSPASPSDRQAPIELIRLQSGAIASGGGANVPAPLTELMHGGLERKISSRLPAFWDWPFFEKWLVAPPSLPQTLAPGSIGPPRLALSRRTHVAISPSTQTAADGMLFSTSGLDFAFFQPSTNSGSGAASMEQWAYSLFSVFDLPLSAPASPALPLLHALGGERRLAIWESSTMPLPQCPAALQTSSASRRYRIVLVTPGAFSQGWLPEWLSSGEGCPPTAPGIRLRLVSAAIAKPLPISGWDLHRRGPKPSRLLVPAGSVYIVESSSDLSPLWFQSISDSPQDRVDGFGVVALGLA